MKTKPESTALPKPKRTRALHVRVSDRERAAISNQVETENLASISDLLRKAALDRAQYQFNPTKKNP